MTGLGGVARGRWRALAGVLVTMLALAGANLVYTNWVDRSSNRKWCELISTLDDSYKAARPQTAAGQKVAADIAKLRVDLGC